MFFRKMRFRWVRFHIEISKVTGPNFTGLVSPNAGGIAVDKIFVRFYRYLYFASRAATNTIKTVTKQAHTQRKTDLKK